MGIDLKIKLLSAILREILHKIGLEWRPYWNSRWRPPGGSDFWGTPRKSIARLYTITVPNLVLSWKSERSTLFFGLNRLTNKFHFKMKNKANALSQILFCWALSPVLIRANTGMMQDESRNTQIGVITFHDNLRPRPKTKGPANNRSKRGPVNNRKVIGRKRTDKKAKKRGRKREVWHDEEITTVREEIKQSPY